MGAERLHERKLENKEVNKLREQAGVEQLEKDLREIEKEKQEYLREHPE